MLALTEQFNSISKQYDEQRKYLIPCLNDFYKSCLPIIDSLPPNSKVLDMGAGTGCSRNTSICIKTNFNLPSQTFLSTCLL